MTRWLVIWLMLSMPAAEAFSPKVVLTQEEMAQLVQVLRSCGWKRIEYR